MSRKRQPPSKIVQVWSSSDQQKSSLAESRESTEAMVAQIEQIRARMALVRAKQEEQRMIEAERVKSALDAETAVWSARLKMQREADRPVKKKQSRDGDPGKKAALSGEEARLLLILSGRAQSWKPSQGERLDPPLSTQRKIVSRLKRKGMVAGGYHIRYGIFLTQKGREMVERFRNVASILAELDSE